VAEIDETMASSRRLPGGERLFIGDGGLETALIFQEGLELPCFASYPLLRDDAGTEALRRYYAGFLEIARREGVGFTFDTPTWRANADWGERLGDSAAELAEVNREAVGFAMEIRAAMETTETPIAVCGAIGPQSDAYEPQERMSIETAERYHSAQVETFAGARADLVSAYTLCYADEAIGIVRAAAASEIPVTISFTLETDGRLPSGQGLGEAIELVDAETNGAAAYFMVNCAHPTHFADVIERDEPWLQRLGGIRANASRMSHTELDEATELDAGDPDELGGEYRSLKPHLPNARVLGGCCGTDHRHVASACRRWLASS
jgi:S-methylmethionine-dependent homocysteine/selenocysteine methylase